MTDLPLSIIKLPKIKMQIKTCMNSYSPVIKAVEDLSKKYLFYITLFKLFTLSKDALPKHRKICKKVFQ